MTGGLATVDFARFARDGIVAMSSDEALQLLDTAMIVDEPFVLPAHIDLVALRAKFDGGTLPPMFVDLINAHARRQVDDSLAAAKSKSALLQRLEGLPEDEQHAVLLDLVRSHIATVLGTSSPEAIDPDRAFQELGFDSLTAVEMRNRLKSATGLALSPTLIFDYPNPAALAGYIHHALVGATRQDAPQPRPAKRNSSAWWRPFRSSACARQGCWICCSRWQMTPTGTGRRRARRAPPQQKTSPTWTSMTWSTRRS